MKKKIGAALLLSTILLSGCGNKSFIDTKWTFKEAVIKVGDTYETITVEKWNDYDDGIVQVVSTGGKVYLTHYNNIVLIGE